MRSTYRSVTRAALGSCLVLLLTACGLVITNPASAGFINGQSSSGGSGSAAVTITLTGPVKVTLGGKSQYAAAVTGSSDVSVDWSVNGVPGGDATVGVISTTGLYVAPATAPSAPTVTITATSQASPSAAQSLAVALAAPPVTPAPVPVTVAVSGAASVTLGAASQYAATVTGTTNTSVTWSVNGVAGGNATAGTITAAGLYQAPATMPSASGVTITATSVADPSVAQSLTVALAAPPPPQSPAPVTLTMSGAPSVTLGTTAQYAATVQGSTNTAVTWRATSGTISASGLYTAPAKMPSSPLVMITATSVADPSVKQTLAVGLVTPPAVQPTQTVALTLSGPTSVTLGASSQYSAVVTGSGNKNVTWSVNGVQGGSATTGAITKAGVYTAPATMPSSATVIITATSVANPSVSQNLAVTLVAPAPVPVVTLSMSGATSVTLGTTSQYSATVTGTSNTGVQWSVNGVLGGSGTYGMISGSGLYTAPANMPSSSTITITATSAADSSVSKSLSVTLVAQAPVVTLSLSGATSVTLGTTSQYSATVMGTSNTGVQWSVNGALGGNSTYGVISGSGLYTAPTTMPSSSSITITATSAADSSVSKSMSVTLVAPTPVVTLSLSGATSVTLGTTSQYSATVMGTSNTGVNWSVNGTQGGNSTYGMISGSGLYTAPTSMPSSSTITITATSAADSSVSKSLSVTLVAPAPVVTLSLSGATSVTLGTTSQYSATVKGTSNTGVQWSVNGVLGGNGTYGVITGSGLYTAPTTMPSSSTITITATSAADSSVSQKLTVTLVAPAPVITLSLSGATSVTLGTTSQYSATVKGTSNTGVNWSVNGVLGGSGTYGVITGSGLYTAPSNMPSSSTVTITATSAADSSVSQKLSVTLVAPVQPVTLSLSGATSVTLGATSQYIAKVTGSTTTGVSWTVNGLVGGTAAYGTISTAGLYKAPSAMPSPSTITIAAISVADTSVSKSLVVTLAQPTAPSTSRIPSNAISSGDLNASSNWHWNHDPGTPGSSSGTTVYAVSGMSPDNSARQFYATYSGHGGEIYHLSFARDTNATHFVYDTNVYIEDPSQVKAVEMDMNQVMADGRTVILATQCTGWSKTWEFTTQSSGSVHWHASTLPCDPETWTARTWHHIQIATHRDNSGNVTYDWVSLDGVYSDFQNATGNSALSLGWATGDLLLNFQIDGASSTSGSMNVYMDNLTIYRW